MRALEERACWVQVCAWVYLRILRNEGTCSSVRLEYESLYIFEQSSCQCEGDAYLFTSLRNRLIKIQPLAQNAVSLGPQETSMCYDYQTRLDRYMPLVSQ